MDELDGVLSDVAATGQLLTVQPGGNHGDTFIYRGFDAYLETTSIDRVRLEDRLERVDAPPEIPSTNLKRYAGWTLHQLRYVRHRLRNDVSAVYIHGGGNFNDMWKFGIGCYRTAARHFDCPIVVGPQSCQFDETDPARVFERVDNETHFFCRERYSYEIVEDATRHLDHVQVYLEDDTALFHDADDLPVTEFGEEYTLLAMRMDKDSANPIIEDDVSAPVNVNDFSKMAETYEDWIDVAARASYIYTDRLHGAILGHVLGKPITWYDTGYHKNRGVYEYSLSDDPDIEFVYRD